VVFDVLSAAKVIESPDRDLREVLGLDREPAPPPESDSPLHEPSEHHGVGFATPQKLERAKSFRPLGLEDHDAFDHETDALDFCGNEVLRDFCYGEDGCAPPAPLEPYMASYSATCRTGMRLGEDVFEQMNLLPPGTMEELRPHCQILAELVSGTELPEEDGTLYFILQGSVALVDVSPGVGSGPQPYEVLTRGSSGVPVAAKGFHGRGGKRLRKRYPPGNVVGNYSFFLRMYDRLIDPGLVCSMIVSSKFSRTTEVWALRRSVWGELPAELRRRLHDMVTFQLADERQHTLLSGE